VGILVLLGQLGDVGFLGNVGLERDVGFGRNPGLQCHVGQFSNVGLLSHVGQQRSGHWRIDRFSLSLHERTGLSSPVLFAFQQIVDSTIRIVHLSQTVVMPTEYPADGGGNALCVLPSQAR
jgi:hypothetical protein